MSLPAHETLFHCALKIGQRSAGKSAVAAAAYRAGMRLTDQRTGRIHDYMRKAVEDRLILTPKGAPAWCRDRSDLWNRSELAAPRKDSQVWREVELSIPRDLPRCQWSHLAAAVARPYVEAGAVVDCNFHSPVAADGQEQPHIHIMVTLRALDFTTSTGFSPRKNMVLENIFGTNGKGDPAKVTAERERIANVFNAELRRVGCIRRADHRSYAERGDNRQPEPKMTEQDARRYARQRHQHEQGGPEPIPSQQQQAIREIRYAKRIASLLTETEIAMHEASKNPYTMKYEVKEAILRQKFPDLDIRAAGIAHDAIHRVDVTNPQATRVIMRDGAVVDIRSGRILVYGESVGSEGDIVSETVTPVMRLAMAIANSQRWDADVIERLPARVGKRTQKDRYRSHDRAEDEISRRLDAWRRLGYADAIASPQGVWVSVGGSTSILDAGDRCTLHGPVTDEAIRAMVEHTKAEWSGSHEIFGSEDFKKRIWLESMRRGVRVTNYDPPPHLLAQWQAESKRRAKDDAAVGAVQDRAVIARQLLAHLRGDGEEAPTPALEAWAANLTQAQARAVAASEPWQIIPQLDAWTAMGKAQEEAGIAAPKPKPEPKPAPADEPAAPRFWG